MSRIHSVFGGRFRAVLFSGSVIGLAIFALVMIVRGSRGETVVLQVQPVSDPNTIQVWVGGEVTTPGLYALPRGSRVANAIDAAGGTTARADTTSLGMSAVVDDADQIIVPALRPTVTPAPTFGMASGVATAPAAPAHSPGLININTAPATELDSLPGIGPALADRIIQHRLAHGPFQSVDELEVIPGISARMVDEMRHLISVGD